MEPLRSTYIDCWTAQVVFIVSVPQALKFQTRNFLAVYKSVYKHHYRNGKAGQLSAFYLKSSLNTVITSPSAFFFGKKLSIKTLDHFMLFYCIATPITSIPHFDNYQHVSTFTFCTSVYNNVCRLNFTTLMFPSHFKSITKKIDKKRWKSLAHLTRSTHISYINICIQIILK